MREFADVVHGIIYGEEKPPKHADISTFDPLFDASDDESATGPALNPMEVEGKKSWNSRENIKIFQTLFTQNLVR